MNKMFSFVAGAISGAIVGAVAVLLLTPNSGEELRAEMMHRWEEALAEAKQAMEDTRSELQTQFEQMQTGNYQE